MSFHSLLFASILVFSAGVPQQKHPVVDTNITNTYDPNFDLVGDYIVNAYINDLDTLEEYANTVVRPANAICYINKDGYMTDKNGTSFDEPYSDIFGWYLKDKMIPVFYIKDEESADSLIAFYNETLRYDMGAMSEDPTLLAKVKEACSPLHMILDYSKQKDEDLSLKDMVATSNRCGATTVVMSPSFATRENMFYMHARFKTVWVSDEDVEDIELLRQVTDGAYGCIVNKPVETIQLIKDFTEKSLNKKYNYNRPVMNVAHRGLCQTMWENSLEGCIAAYERGATHFEIDIQVTKDKKLAIMHDDTIDRTTTGTGRISDYTAEELKQFRIDSALSVKLTGEGVAIPMLDDFFDEFKGKDIVIIVEIKTSDINCVSILKDYLEEADIKDQVVVISFYSAQLQRMKQTLPEIPIADLNSYTEGGFINSLKMLGSYNMVIDTNSANFSRGFAHKMAERGFASWFWTYDNFQILYDGMKKGVVGVTNNLADSLTHFPKKLAVAKEMEIVADDFESISIQLPYINYLNKESEELLEASPIFVKKGEDEKTAQVIFQAKFLSGDATPKFMAVVFSDVVTVKLVEEVPPETSEDPNKQEETSKKSSGCGGYIAASSAILTISALMGIIFLSRRRKEEK